MIRLIEHSPAWEVHAYLRFADVAYLSEYCPAPTALGRVLPVAVDRDVVHNSEQIYHCPKVMEYVRTLSSSSTEIDDMVACYLQCSVVRLFEQVLWQRNEHVTSEREHGAFLVGSCFAQVLELTEMISLPR